MRQLTINPNNRQYYSEDFIKGFNCGAHRQFEADSADRPQGEWRKHDEERDYCSHCKHIFKTRTITKQDKWINYIDDLGYNYCPNCGARMRGDKDGTRRSNEYE